MPVLWSWAHILDLSFCLIRCTCTTPNDPTTETKHLSHAYTPPPVQLRNLTFSSSPVSLHLGIWSSHAYYLF